MSFNETINLTGTVAPDKQGSIVDVNEKLHETSEAIKKHGRTPENIRRALDLVQEMSRLIPREINFREFKHKNIKNFKELDRLHDVGVGLCSVNYLSPDKLVVSYAQEAKPKVIDLSKIVNRDFEQDVFVEDIKTDKRVNIATRESNKQDYWCELNENDFAYINKGRITFCVDGVSRQISYPRGHKFCLPLEDHFVLTDSDSGFLVVDYKNPEYPIVKRSGEMMPDLTLGKLHSAIKLQNGNFVFGTDNNEIAVVDFNNQNAPLVWHDEMPGGFESDVIKIVEYAPNRLYVISRRRTGGNDLMLIAVDINTYSMRLKESRFPSQYMLPLGDGFVCYADGYRLFIKDLNTNKDGKVIYGEFGEPSAGPKESQITDLIRLPDGRLVVSRLDGKVIFYGDPDVDNEV